MQPDPGSDERIVREFRANEGVVLGLPGGVVLLHAGPAPRDPAPVAAVLEGGAWLVAAVETASGSLDVVAVELDGDEARAARSRFSSAVGDAPVFRLEPRG